MSSQIVEDESAVGGAEPAKAPDAPPNPLKEIVQPFIDLIHAPRALWGINLPYFLEGMVYFGILGYLAIYFSEHVFTIWGVPYTTWYGYPIPDVNSHSHHMVMVQTAGITAAMFFLGSVADKIGVRKALLIAFSIMFVGRLIICAAPSFELTRGLNGGLQMATLAGILLVVIGYGMYQPAAYAGVRKFTNEKTSAMGFAMLYALMNLGGYLPTFAFFIRDHNYLNWGIVGVLRIYAGVTLVALLATWFILSPRTEKEAISRAQAERDETKGEVRKDEVKSEEPLAPMRVGYPPPSLLERISDWIVNHPLADPKFAFFIFALIPVQTLFTYNWLILPQYVKTCYTGWIGEYFEIASNFNPLLIFIFVPVITALTYKSKVYHMMIAGTLVMAVPAFLLATGTNGFTLFGYLVLMTVGEAMWQPRFLQYAAEIAPEGRTGQYMGVAQLPWFLTKMLVPLIYSGWMLDRYCPEIGARNPQTMWFIFGCIAIATPILLMVAKGWVGRDFKTKAA